MADALAGPRNFISLPPQERVQADIVDHLAKANQLLKDVNDQRPYLPAITYNQHTLQIRGVIEPLEVLLRNYDSIVEGGPKREVPPWEKLPGGLGGRRLQIPEDMLEFYVKGGLRDHQIGEVFGCRRETIGRRRRAMGLKKKGRCEMTAEEIAAVGFMLLLCNSCSLSSIDPRSS